MKTRLLLTTLAATAAAHAFNASGQRWTAGDVRFQLSLPPLSTPLKIGRAHV